MSSFFKPNLFIFSFIFLIVYCQAKSWRTDSYSCDECFYNGYTHCVDVNFTESACSDAKDPAELEKFTDKYEYCTTNETSWEYKEFTCPMENCPQGFFYEHTEPNNLVTINKTWSNQSAVRCKMAFWAKDDLNGKLVVELQ